LLPAKRGGCSRAAIREDILLNLDAPEDLM
jgi:hypothetical protein